MYSHRILRKYIGQTRRNWRLRRIYQQCREFTMIPEPAFYDNLQIAEKVRKVRGCVVECGVWRGGMSAGLCRLLGPNRTYYLFDSFEGLPPAQPIDGAAAIQWQQNKTSPTYYENCSAPPDFARRAMEQVGARSFHLVAGWFNNTLPNFEFADPIALLRLDADWYDSTRVCLEYLFDHVAEKGVIILDDYFAWDGCSRALHDFLSSRSATVRIRNLRDVCYLMKKPTIVSQQP